jgi:hypothetical protein
MVCDFGHAGWGNPHATGMVAGVAATHEVLTVRARG